MLIPSGEYQGDDWVYWMEAGAIVEISVKSDVAVNVMLGRESDYRRWRNAEATDLVDGRENVFRCTLDHRVKTKNAYALWIENDKDEDAIVEVGIVIWPPEGDEDE